MGFRIGWWAKKWFGITWGPTGGFRLYGMFGGRGGGGGCLVPLMVLLGGTMVLLAVVVKIWIEFARSSS